MDVSIENPARLEFRNSGSSHPHIGRAFLQSGEDQGKVKVILSYKLLLDWD